MTTTSNERLYDLLAATPREWELRAGGAIRHRNDHCPLSFLAGSATPCVLNGAQQKFGLSWRRANEIANAADGIKGCDKAIRRRLLQVCGLAR